MSEDKVIAVLVDSAVLGLPVWVSEKADFVPGDGIPVFSQSELKMLDGKSADHLRKVYEVKQIFGGGKVVKVIPA